MERNEVGQLYYINKEIMMWMKELHRVRNQSHIKSQQITGMPHVSGISDKTADRAVLEAEYEEIINNLEYKACVQRAKNIKFIENIEDSFDRQIVFLRCSACLPWRAIADEMGGDNTEDSIRMRFNRLFEKN